MITLEEQQEINLHANWEVRKDLASKIGTWKIYDIYDYQSKDGHRVFYVTRGMRPLGYVSCWMDLDGKTVLINSTFVSENARGLGLATATYLTIIQTVAFLKSDYDRSVGGEALWVKLSKDPSIRVCKEDNHYIATKL